MATMTNQEIEELIEIVPSGPGMLKILLHRRHSRVGRMHERHPRLKEVLGDE